MRSTHLFWVLWAFGCAKAPPKDVIAEITYTAQQTACVEKAKTLEESKACRREIDTKWFGDAGDAE